jgi:hypothetical protein
MLLLARVAEKWHCRPSQLLRSHVAEFQIDLACALLAWQEDEREAEHMRERFGK